MSVPDWLEYVNAAGTAVAALLAAGAIVQSTINSNKNEKALIRERRIDFELGVLADLSQLNTQDSNVVTRDARMKARAAMLSKDLIPITRAAFNLDTTPDAYASVEATSPNRSELRQTRPDYFKKQIETEILAAITSRLEDRA
ncbi:hypothetical protein ACIBHY_17050 [Nonomuraea sp. NPDC050547]|uniref:hypothetical protein n=1 Tax=Nonomuraea sp. NPDC050547 TaxID=3364368 RepID=UPI00379E5902